MPRYKFPNGNEQDLSVEVAALYPDLEMVAEESYDERMERERRDEARRVAEAEAAKVQLEDENGEDVVPPEAQSPKASVEPTELPGAPAPANDDGSIV